MKNYQLSISFAVLSLMGCKEKTYRDQIYSKPEIVREAPSDFLTPEESMETFYLPEGFKIELVASEPMINEPVDIAWDGNGRMYVTQMETYMQNVDGDGTDEPTSRIMLLEDTDGDGKMDKSSVFIDNLLLPRMILPLDDRLVVNETYSYNLVSYRDTDKDGVADEKIPIFTHPDRRGGNLEHQQSGLVWNLDNWVYMTYNPVRFKFNSEGVVVDTLQNMPGGQWGLTQDDMGHMYYSSAGGENPAYGFQQPVNYGRADPPGRLSEGFIEPWPVVGTPDVQGGAERRLRADGTLNHFTGVAGQEIFRGHRLPPFLYGDLFIPEPVGRLVRRAKVQNENGKKVLYNAYDQTEFMASTDLNFRPVQAKTGPDGALYIVDMYRGIIQESAWTREGSEIRPVILRKGLDRNFGRGRIYRIVHEDIKPDGRPQLLGKSAMELLDYLGHPNGWYRNTAQKLIVLKGDRSVVPKLRKMALNNESFWPGIFGKQDRPFERIHALWTLEGLDALDKDLVVKKYKDADPRLRIMAIRLSDEFLKEDADLLPLLSQFQFDPDINVVNQLALSLRNSSDPKAMEILTSISEKYADNEIVSKSVLESLKEKDSDLQELKGRIAKESNSIKSSIMRGYDNYQQSCVTCHGTDLRGIPNDNGSLIAPPLLGSETVMGNQDLPIKILLNGLSGPINGQEYGVMLPMANNSDEWIGNIVSYIRAMNNVVGAVNKEDVQRIREETQDRKTYWTLEELQR